MEGVFRTERDFLSESALFAVDGFRTRLAAVVEEDVTLASEERRGRRLGKGGADVCGERDIDRESEVRKDAFETVEAVEILRVRELRDSRGAPKVDDDVDTSFLLALDATEGGRAGGLGGRSVADVDGPPPDA